LSLPVSPSMKRWNHHAIDTRRVHEVDVVVGPFGEGVDGTENVPARVFERLDHGTVDVSGV